jgi:DNA-binding transcriptional regulator LsrR (DeoR family)
VIPDELADALVRATRQAKDGTAERNRLIRQASAQGATAREIARLIGLSHTGVQRILDPGNDEGGPASSP